MAERRISGEKLLWTSSSAKITPARGALKAAESPAEAPLERKSRSSTFPFSGGGRSLSLDAPI